MNPFREGSTRSNVKVCSDSPRPSHPPPAPQPLDGPIVWLEVGGELRKCKISAVNGMELRYIAGCVSMARSDDLQDAVDYWVAERTRVAADIVTRGEYEVDQ